MLEGVTIEESKAQKDEIIISGNDVDMVSQSAADIHGQTLVRNKDIRKFLDGVSLQIFLFFDFLFSSFFLPPPRSPTYSTCSVTIDLRVGEDDRGRAYGGVRS